MCFIGKCVCYSQWGLATCLFEKWAWSKKCSSFPYIVTNPKQSKSMVAGHLWDVVKHLWELGDDPNSRFAELAFWRRGPKMVLFVNYTKSWFLFTSTSMMSLMSRPADTQPEGRVADVASNNQSFFNNLNFEFKWWFTSFAIKNQKKSRCSHLLLFSNKK